MAAETKPSAVKLKSNSAPDGLSKGCSGKITTSDSKNKAVAAVTNSEVKSKIKPSSSKSTTTSTTCKAREKKVYSLPGQKHDPPEEREPLRTFYESLSKQIPTSEMAEFWLMEHGLLSPERAKKAYEKKQRKQKQQRMGTPIKAPQPSSRPESSSKQQQPPKNGEVKARKKVVTKSHDDDFISSLKKRKG